MYTWLTQAYLRTQHAAAWQRPMTLEWLLAPLNENHLRAAVTPNHGTIQLETAETEPLDPSI